jgi:hypothetical protein
MLHPQQSGIFVLRKENDECLTIHIHQHIHTYTHTYTCILYGKKNTHIHTQVMT